MQKPRHDASAGSVLAYFLASFAACTPDDGKPSESVDTASGAVEPDCADAEARLGYQACVPRIDDDETFGEVTITSSSVDQLRVGKYMVPAVDDARVPGVFLDVNHFPLHYDFLTVAFPDRFPGLTTAQYEALILYRETREFYAGTLSLYLTGDGGYYYGFTVWDDPADDASTVTMEEVGAAWTEVQARFGLAELYWVPNSENQRAAAAAWTDAPFPIGSLAEIEYEVYSEGDAYGYLRLYTLEEFATASEAATFSWQDIVVVEEAPEDIERVVSGIVTGTRQGTLSHLNIRSSIRGTPNCFVADPLTALADWEDQLVHFTCGATDYAIESATEEEATAWWDELRPDPIDICEPNLIETGMPGLLETDTSKKTTRQGNICTWGAKGANLTTLYQRIDAEWQLDGFLIPFSAYDRFVTEGTWTVDLGDGQGPATHSFQATLDAWHADATFLSDAALRGTMLDELRVAMMAAPIPTDIEEAIRARVLEVFVDPELAVRFRSSSNAEDDVLFAGAGLYDSNTGCLADDLDGNSSGPSNCDADETEDETVADAVRGTWASLWKVSAWEERSWYGIDPAKVKMGILVDNRAKGEQANAVAFSGNPSDAYDDRYLVQAQPGELEVVAAEAGVYPESDLLTVLDGVLTNIERVSESSTGEIAMTDAYLEALGEQYWVIDEVYPQDYDLPEGYNLIWDTEWKILSDGRLVVKQIRPFIRPL